MRENRLFYFSAYFVLLVCCLHTGTNLYAQKNQDNPPPLTQITFSQLYGGVIIIKATLDDYKDSLNFILDTGSGGISLDSLSALALQVKMEPSEKTIRGIAGIKPVQFAYNHSLNIKGMTVDSLDFHINDYEILSGIYGIRIDGIIGYSFFRRYIVAVDFDVNVMSVYPSGDFNYPKRGYKLRPNISALPMQFASLKENRTIKGRYYLDTGGGLCLLLSSQFVKDSSVFGSKKNMYSSIADGLGGKKETRITYVKRFKLGPYKFKKMPTLIFDDEFNVTSYPFLFGLIGNDLLRRFNMVINYGKSEIHLIPNKSFKQSFDYSYTGFNMYQDDGDVKVIDVIPGSPADESGLRDGDIILSIGNKFAGTLQEYKTMLGEPGLKLKIVILRNGQIEEIKFTIANILKRYKIPKKRKGDS